MNDDFFAIKPVLNLEKSINLSLGLLEEAIKIYKITKESSRWKRAFKQVYDLLKSLNIPEPYYNYESHTPLIINKSKYLEVMNLPKVLQFRKTKNVLHKRTLYKNIDKKEKTITLSIDVKIEQKEDDTSKRINVCDWLSVYDGQVKNPQFKDLNKLLQDLFSEPCKYEKLIALKTKTKMKKNKFMNF